MMAAVLRWMAMVRHELRVTLANPGVLVGMAALIVLPPLAALAGPVETASRIVFVRGIGLTAVALGLPILAGLLGSGILRSRVSTQELSKGVSRFAVASSRLAGVSLTVLLAGIGIVLAVEAVDPGGTLQEFGRPVPGKVASEGAAPGKDGRWWLVGDRDFPGSIEFELPVAAGIDSARIEVRVDRGVPKPGSSWSAGDSEPASPSADANAAPVVAFYRNSASGSGDWIRPVDQTFRSSRLTFSVPRGESDARKVSIRITRNAGELIPGIHLADVRVSGSSSPTVWSWAAMLAGSLMACVLVAAAGLAFGAIFTRATALLACLCVLVVGTLAPVLHLGEKPKLLRELEAGVESAPEADAGPTPAPDPFAWVPHVALPASRDRLLAGEVVTLKAAAEEVRNTGWIALALVLVGWGLLFWRDWEDATADT